MFFSYLIIFQFVYLLSFALPSHIASCLLHRLKTASFKLIEIFWSTISCPLMFLPLTLVHPFTHKRVRQQTIKNPFFPLKKEMVDSVKFKIECLAHTNNLKALSLNFYHLEVLLNCFLDTILDKCLFYTNTS